MKGGTILFAVYAWPVPLYNGEEVTGTAKWIGFQKPNGSLEFTRLYYGDTFYDIDGAFEIKVVIPLPSKH